MQNSDDSGTSGRDGRSDISSPSGLEGFASNEQQFRMLVQSVTDYAIYMIGPTGDVISWNAGAQRIKGYAPEEIIGQNFSRFYTEEDRAVNAPQKALETARTEGRFEKEGWRVRKDGTRFWASVVIDPIRDPSGKLIGFAKITRDFTERRAAQRAYDEIREQLAQSQKMEAVGRLTGGIAHDFNNLLMAVLSSLELMRKRLPDDPAMLRLLENAVQGAERGAALTQRMLAFARRQELAPKAVDVAGLVSDMADLLKSSLGPSINLVTDFPPTLPPAHTDPNQLESALLNLAVNAQDAMPTGGPIVIAAREQVMEAGNSGGLAPGQYICLCVTDKGEGMSEETLARATEPFFTTKGVGKGTGLGLSMVQGLIEQSGGRLALKSRPGEGTRVELWLPVSTSSREPASVAGARDSSAEKMVDRNLTIVVVDDDGLVRMNTAAMLEDLGHTVFEASSGKEALRILSQEDGVDLVVSDQAMPQMTGTQLAAAIREDRPDMPIILATGYAELPPGEGQDLPRLGKPFSQSDLARVIADTLRNRVTAGRA